MKPQVEDLVRRCIEQVEAQPLPFPARSFLLPVLLVLEEGSGSGGYPDKCKGPSVLQRLCSHQFSDALFSALADALTGCLLVLAVLSARNDSERSQRMTQSSKKQAVLQRRDVFCPNAVLRSIAQRISSIGTAIKEPNTFLATQFLLNGPLAALWGRRFQGLFKIRVCEFLEALAETYDPLNKEERNQMLGWLHPDDEGFITAVDAARVCGCPGPWRGLLFCTSWTELCRTELRQSIAAGGGERHLAMTAADIVRETQVRQKAVLLPGWSRERLRKHKSLHAALQLLGMCVAADAGSNGLLVQFLFDEPPQLLRSSGSSLRQTLVEELNLESFNPLKPEQQSIARCVAEAAPLWFSIDSPRSRHMTLENVHRRTKFDLSDDVKHMLDLQALHQSSLRNRLECKADVRDVLKLSIEHLEEDGNALLGLSDMTLKNAQICRESAEFVQAKVEEEFGQLGAPGMEEAIEPQLKMFDVDEAFSNLELELLQEVNLCMTRQISTRKDISAMETDLMSIEASFDENRHKLTQYNKKLDQRIAESERELVRLSALLASKREFARAAGDALLDMRLVLAEAMVPVPFGGSITALSESLAADVQELKSRSEELQKHYTKAKATSKKR